MTKEEAKNEYIGILMHHAFYGSERSTNPHHNSAVRASRIEIEERLKRLEIAERAKKTVKDRIKEYDKQGLKVGPLLHNPDIELSENYEK